MAGTFENKNLNHWVKETFVMFGLPIQHRKNSTINVLLSFLFYFFFVIITVYLPRLSYINIKTFKCKIKM